MAQSWDESSIGEGLGSDVYNGLPYVGGGLGAGISIEEEAATNRFIKGSAARTIFPAFAPPAVPPPGTTVNAANPNNAWMWIAAALVILFLLR